jgi:hypothetical protein
MGGSDKVRQTREEVVLQERITASNTIITITWPVWRAQWFGRVQRHLRVSASKLMPRIVYLVQHEALLEEGVGQALSGLLDHL